MTLPLWSLMAFVEGAILACIAICGRLDARRRRQRSLELRRRHALGRISR